MAPAAARAAYNGPKQPRGNKICKLCIRAYTSQSESLHKKWALKNLSKFKSTTETAKLVKLTYHDGFVINVNTGK